MKNFVEFRKIEDYNAASSLWDEHFSDQFPFNEQGFLYKTAIAYYEKNQLLSLMIYEVKNESIAIDLIKHTGSKHYRDIEEELKLYALRDIKGGKD